jgi:hypothetical protein
MQGGRKKSFWITGLEKNYIALGLLKIVKIEKKLADPPTPQHLNARRMEKSKMADFGGVGTGRKSENQKSRNRRKQANNTTNTLSLSLSPDCCYPPSARPNRASGRTRCGDGVFGGFWTVAYRCFTLFGPDLEHR